MRTAVTLVFALCAALTLRVRPTHCRLQEHLPNSDQDNSHCEDPPWIRIDSGYYKKWNHYARRNFGWAKGENKVSIAYGSSLRVFCGRPTNADKLAMTRSGENLATEKQYLNAIVSTRKQDLLISKDKFVCTDVEFNCTSSVIVLVTPAFKVISHNVQISDDDDYTNYTVQYGDPVTALCSGPDADCLVMSQDGDPLLTERESNTTIKCFVDTSLLISEYGCTDVSTSYNSSVTIKVVPGVYLQSQNETITPFPGYKGLHLYYLEYRNSDVEIYCFGPRAVKLTGHGEDDNILFTENFISVNPHTVKYISKLKLGTWCFECSDNEFPDYVTRMEITIKPQMVVMSANVRRVAIGSIDIHYGIKYGDTIEIICSGTESDELHVMYAINHEPMGVGNKGIEITLNSTAIKYILKDPGMDKKIKFQCSKKGCFWCNTLRLVGVLPADVTDFRCVSHEGQTLNCTWTAPSREVNFTLSYVENAILNRICVKPRSSRKSKSCVLDYEYNDEQAMIKEFVLLLQSCNSVGCSNQTFHVDHLSVVKSAPPWDLLVLNIKPRSAVLTWFGNFMHVAGVYLSGSNNDFDHKVQYWYSGIGPREVNSSLVTCSEIECCKIELNLPCPGQFYEVWIYEKLKTAVGDEFWSNPTSVSFHTVVDNDKINDATCSWKPRKTPEVMKYFIQEHKQEVHLDMQALREKVISLKDKLGISKLSIRTYIKQQGKGTR